MTYRDQGAERASRWVRCPRSTGPRGAASFQGLVWRPSGRMTGQSHQGSLRGLSRGTVLLQRPGNVLRGARSRTPRQAGGLARACPHPPLRAMAPTTGITLPRPASFPGARPPRPRSTPSPLSHRFGAPSAPVAAILERPQTERARPAVPLLSDLACRRSAPLHPRAPARRRPRSVTHPISHPRPCL